MQQLIFKLVAFFSVFTVSISLANNLGNTPGGGNDGGGNTYQGKPLESYAQNPILLKSFENYIAPLLSDLESKQANDNSLRVLKDLITSIFSQKIWYFVPGPLEQIPDDILSSAVRTDQAAIQGFDRIWIDETIWKTMTVEDQGKLLLHETFMGLKILKYASDYRLCLASHLSSSCVGRNQNDSAITLNPKDYIDVQKMTIQIFSQYTQMANGDWIKVLNENGIKFKYNWFDEVSFISPLELGKLLAQSSLSGFLPTYAYNLRAFDSGSLGLTTHQEMYDYLQNNKDSCNISAKVVGEKLDLKVTTSDESFSGSLPLKKEMESTYDAVSGERKILKRIGLDYITGQERSTGGFSMYIIWLGFDSYRLANISIQEMVCEDPKCETSSYIDVKAGMHLICSEDPKLFRP